jgi:hypothetical protein
MCLGLAYALRASYSRLTPVQYHRAACDNGLSCGLRRVPCAAPALEPLVAGAAFICSSLHLGPHSHRHRSTLALRRIPSTFTARSPLLASPLLPHRIPPPTSAGLRLPGLPSAQERPHTPEDHSTTGDPCAAARRRSLLTTALSYNSQRRPAPPGSNNLCCVLQPHLDSRYVLSLCIDVTLRGTLVHARGAASDPLIARDYVPAPDSLPGALQLGLHAP